MEEILRDEANNVETDTNNNYIEAINQLKQNTVSKDKYNQLVEENARLVKSLVDGGTVESSSEETIRPRIEVLKDYNENKMNTNLDYWKTQLELRDATIKEYGRDPWVTGNYGFDKDGQIVIPDQDEIDEMEEQANTIKEIIKDCNGDPIEFSNLFRQACGIRR